MCTSKGGASACSHTPPVPFIVVEQRWRTAAASLPPPRCTRDTTHTIRGGSSERCRRVPRLPSRTPGTERTVALGARGMVKEGAGESGTGHPGTVFDEVPRERRSAATLFRHEGASWPAEKGSEETRSHTGRG